MTWFKVDDGLAFHAKTIQAGNAAMGLWVRAGSWSAHQLTDGFVPDHMAATLGTRGQAKALVDARLWTRVQGGYQFHQWGEEGRQPTRAKVEADREEARLRMKKARDARRTPTDVRLNTPPNDDRSSGDVRVTRPVPSRPDLLETAVGGASPDSNARDDEPPRCSIHRGWARADIPDCVPCGRLRQQWETTRSADATFQRPPWCGGCDQFTRQIETDHGIARCPDCHPLAHLQPATT